MRDVVAPSVYIAVSDYVRSTLVSDGVPVDQVFVRPNLVYPLPLERGARGHKSNDVLFVGRAVPEKGLGTVLDALRARPALPVRLLVAGMSDVPTSDPRVRSLGSCTHSEVLDLMRESICTLVPSTWAEPFGRTVLESLSVSTPVLVSDLGGLRELVGPGVTGVPAGDACAWGEAISALLLEGVDARVARANEARRRFDAEFGPERWWETTMKIFDQVSRARSEAFDEQMGADG